MAAQMLRLLLLLLAGVAGSALAAVQNSPAASNPDALCFNQLQVLGTHNSYHQAPPQALIEQYGGASVSPLLSWQYSHPPLSQQLDSGVRALELDANWDPQGGLFAQAAGLKLVGQDGWLTDPKLKQPGFKVLHVPDFDFRTSCVLLTDCLQEIRDWSEAHPGHLPLQVYLEVKQADELEKAVGSAVVGFLQTALAAGTAPGPTKLVEPPATNQQTYRDLQQEVLSVFGGSSGGGRLLTPDAVRAALGAPGSADMGELLVKPRSGSCPWPPLASMRGKLMLIVLVGSQAQAADILGVWPDLGGSVFWMAQDGGAPIPHAAFLSRALDRLAPGLSMDLPPNASSIVADMASSVQSGGDEGRIVRARADADTIEARSDFVERGDLMFWAGANAVVTDFVVAANEQRSADSATQPLYNTSYVVALPGGLPGRCISTITSGSSGGGSSGSVSSESISTDDLIFCGGEQAEGAPPAQEPAPTSQPVTGGSSSSSGGSSGGVSSNAPTIDAGLPSPAAKMPGANPAPPPTGASSGSSLHPIGAAVATCAAALMAWALSGP